MSRQAQYKSGVALWEVDTQADFMLPGGKLYVPGAEKRIPNMLRLVNAAAANGIFIVSSTDQHAADDPEFSRFPPHCVRGTPGAQIVPELKLKKTLAIENSPDAKIPSNAFDFQQIILEKQTLDVFDNSATEKLLRQFPADCEFIMFGVVTEFCVQLAAKGLLERARRVALVTDAIETLDAKEGEKNLNELAGRDARLITTNDALELMQQTILH
ncbi:MAG TPA: isochorismatase family cysteine hydrolase [Candidatus Acidoferrales bacterium]|nr:isochorismatase family cysteine hydrolase [Candidatus Acidoferrales bacterium]